MMAAFLFDNIFAAPHQGCSIHSTAYAVKRVGDTLGGLGCLLFYCARKLEPCFAEWQQSTLLTSMAPL
jgi:hypothetical protein